MSLMSRARSGGFSLLELMIALVVGLVILAALGQVFVAGQSSYSLQDRFGALQENGRYALYFLQRDIRNAGLPMLDYDDAFTPADTLDGGGNVSDQIGIRYRATIAGTTDCLGNNIALNAVVRTVYSIHVDPLTGVSRLRCAAQGQPAQPIVDGIENMQILYGLDLDTNASAAGYGYADVYLPRGDISDDQLRRRVVSVRVAILTSSITPVIGDKETDNTASFVLLNAPPVPALVKPFPFPGGQQRALRGRVFSSTIEVRNRTSG